MKPACSRRTFLARSAVCTAAWGLTACSPRPAYDGPPNVVVYLADSLRADALGCYGGASRCSPSIDAFAKGAYLFEACYSQSNWTKPSIASLFTGMLPRVHKAAVTPWRAGEDFHSPPRILREQFTTWAEAMAAQGYQTASFQSNPHPREEFGFAHGFDLYHFSVNELAGLQVQQFEGWVRQAKHEPFFAFIHQIDPHGPYTPSARDFLDTHGMLRQHVADRVSREDLQRIAEWTHAYEMTGGDALDIAHDALRELAPEGLTYFRGLYEAEIRRVDHAFAALQNCLRREGLADRTVVVFASDHGEAFGERGFFGHGNFLYNEEMRVPLLIKLPGQRHSVRVPYSVSLFDLYPTGVALAGGAPDSALMAAPLFDSDARLLVEEDRDAFAELDLPMQGSTLWSQTMVRGRQALVRWRMGEGEEECFAFDLEQDPRQRKRKQFEAVANSPEWGEPIEDFWNAIQQHRRLAVRSGPPEYAETSAEYEEQLRSLGYV